MHLNDGAAPRSAPLEGVVVLDLTQFLAGPNATQLLADMGARVIKVEPPAGDPSRDIPPHFVNDLSAYFISANRSKESIVVDLKAEAGRSLFLRLAKRADVVVENFRPGVVERLGVSYDDVIRVNPEVVYCSITGFGADGPGSDRPAYDIIVQALSGVMSVNGEAGRAPARLGIPVGDLAAGMFAACGMVAALFERSRTGRGRRVEVSMLGSLVSMLSYLGQYYLSAGVVAGPQGSGHVSIPTYRSFLCADGEWVVVAANTERMWAGLCAALGLDSLVDDRRFATNEARLESRQALSERLEPAFLKRTSIEWLEELHRLGVPAAPINTIDRTLADAEARRRGIVVAVEDGEGEELRLLGTPVQMAGGRVDYRPAPHLGEHTQRVLELVGGLTANEIDALVAAGIVGAAVAGEAT